MDSFKQQIFVVSLSYVQALWRGYAKMPKTLQAPDLEDVLFTVKVDYPGQGWCRSCTGASKIAAGPGKQPGGRITERALSGRPRSQGERETGQQGLVSPALSSSLTASGEPFALHLSNNS